VSSHFWFVTSFCGQFWLGKLSSGSTEGCRPSAFAFASPRKCEGDAKAKAEGA